MGTQKDSIHPAKEERRKKRTLFSSLGFTLVELLVVIGIVGLLSSIIFAITRGADEQGRIAKGLYFSQHLHNSLGAYAAGIWNLDEGSGTTTDDTSGWQSNGTLVNSPIWRCASVDTGYTPSGQGCSLELNGSNQYINIGSAQNLRLNGNATFEAWIKTTQTSSYGVIVAESHSWAVGRNYEYAINNGVLIFSHGDGDNYTTYSSDTSVANGKFNHVVFVADYPSYYFYVNGVQVKKGTMSFPLREGVGTQPGAAGRIIGGLSWTMYFNGLIDEVRIYDSALTITQIKSQYYADLGEILIKNQIII